MLLCLTLFEASAQDRSFLQFFSAPLTLNPAFTGTSRQARAALLHRVQYPQLAGDFVSTAFSYDQDFQDIKSSFGLLLQTDRAGAAGLRSTDIQLSYAYLVPLNEDWRLRLGLSLGYGNKTLNYLNFVFGDQLTPTGLSNLGTQETGLEGLSLQYWDVSSGFLLYNQYIWVGFSAAHLNQPEQAFIDNAYRLPIRYAAHGGLRIPIEMGLLRDEEVSLQPSFSYRMQGGIQQLDLGANFQYQYFTAGLWYKDIPLQAGTAGALALVAAMQYEGLRFAYSYEYAMGALSGLGGAHEIGISYILRFEQLLHYRTRRRYVAFPLFSEYGDKRW